VTKASQHGDLSTGAFGGLAAGSASAGAVIGGRQKHQAWSLSSGGKLLAEVAHHGLL
jgi:hypothetical protein